jgi:hypothetical protein
MASRRKFKAGEFSEHQYKTNNEWGIERVTKFLESRDFLVWDKDIEDYDVDIVAEKNGKLFYYEAEVKTGYPFTSVEDFKFPTVSFLGRKKKYHKRYEEGFYYCIVARETESIVYCHSSEIYKEEYRQIKTINTKHRKGIDEFYLVPKENCSFILMNEY